ETIFDVFEIQRGIDCRNDRIERRARADGITLGRFKIRIINPELLTVTHSQTGLVAPHFAPKLVRRLEPNTARTHDWFFHQTQKPFFLKISLRGPVLTNSCEKVLEL